MTTTKIERLKAIKEEFARTQARLAEVRKLEESAQANAMSTLLENDLEQAELVLAAQDIMHKLQNMAEDLAKMNAQDLFPLVDKMKATFGQEAAHGFEESAQDVITNAMNTVRHAKDELGNSIMRLEGKMPASDMAADANMNTGADMTDPVDGGDSFDAGAEVSGDDVHAAMDSFGGADAASGPQDEPLGRAKKESVEATRAPLKESVILEAAGQRLIETEGLDSLIAWVLSEAAAGMPEEHFRSFATSVATRAAKDPVKLAGWIGKKKHGMAAMAQLADPVRTATPDLSVVGDEITEGKTFKRNDDEDDNWDKKSKDKARSAARKEKQKGDDLEEGKTFRKGDDDDSDKEDRMKSRSAARREKQKGDDKVTEGWDGKSKPNSANYAPLSDPKMRAQYDADMAEWNKGKGKIDETALAAKAVAQLIEASIKREGKGNAAKAVKEATAYLAGKNLVEGDFDAETAVLEAFTAAFGMKPAAYSVLKLKELAPPMSSMDKKNANSALGKLAGTMGANKSAGSQSVQSAMTGMDGQERSAANKMLNKMKQDGQAPKNAGEFAQKAAAMVSDDKDGVNENINAAHWPVDSAGQYKGEPFQTDYNKLKANPKTAAKTEGGAPETKVEEPKVDGAKAPEGGKPWEKKSEPKAEEPKEEEKVDESVEQLDELFGLGKKKAPKKDERPAPEPKPRREYTRAEKDRIEQETGVRFR